MAVKRGTTPIYTLNVGGKSLKRCKVFVTFEQDGKAITKTGDDIDVENKVDESGEPLSVISVSLTQSDTLGSVEVDNEVKTLYKRLSNNTLNI